MKGLQKLATGSWALTTFLLVVLIALALPNSSLAQITFERTYGDTAVDDGTAVQQTSDGGYIVAGYTSSFGAGENDVYLIKTDSLGDTLWIRTYGGSNNDGGRSVQQTTDGGYIIAGYTLSFGVGGVDVYLIKTDSLGDTLWTKTYGGAIWEWGQSVQQTSDGGYIIAGYTNSFGAGQDDVYLIKTDPSGDTLWTKTYGSSGYEQGYSIHQTLDGGYIIAGATNSFGAGLHDVYLIKTNSSGNTLWTKTYGDSLEDMCFSVQQTSDGGYILGGYTESFGAGQDDVWLLKTDSLGDTLWTRTYGGTNNDAVFSVQQTSDGGYILGGYTESFGANMQDVLLLKADSLGDTLWIRTYGGSGNDLGSSVQQTSDGGYIVAGVTRSFGAVGVDVYLIKTDGNGMVVGIEEEDSKLKIPSSKIQLLQNQPNPFSSALGGTVIGYTLPKSAPISLKVYDITGRLVETLVEERQDPGVYQIQWEGKDIGSGIYFYRLHTGDFTATRKLILLR